MRIIQLLIPHSSAQCTDVRVIVAETLYKYPDPKPSRMPRPASWKWEIRPRILPEQDEVRDGREQSNLERFAEKSADDEEL